MGDKWSLLKAVIQEDINNWASTLYMLESKHRFPMSENTEKENLESIIAIESFLDTSRHYLELMTTLEEQEASGGDTKS